MSEQIKLISELLTHVDDYLKTSKHIDIVGFSHFLNNQMLQKPGIQDQSNTRINFEKENYKNYKQYAEIEFSTLLTNLYRFAKHYVKKAFKQTDIKTIDEFGFLASLLRHKHLLKKELINQHLLETSSGSEVLKRLKAKELVTESTYEGDKRARLVSLTPKGVQTIMNSFEEMHKVSEIIIGNLSDDELKQSLKIFNKLSDFHHRIHQENRDSGLNEIHTKHISKNKD